MVIVLLRRKFHVVPKLLRASRDGNSAVCRKAVQADQELAQYYCVQFGRWIDPPGFHARLSRHMRGPG
eukprot:4832853-Pyramimonas_sp.AAC.1